MPPDDFPGAIVGVGLDLVDCRRFGRLLPHTIRSFQDRVFTDVEWDACAHKANRIPALAARWAAKEACLKALGTGWAEGLFLREVILHEAARSRSRVELTGAAAQRAQEVGVRHIHVSVQYDRHIAAAWVLLTR